MPISARRLGRFGTPVIGLRIAAEQQQRPGLNPFIGMGRQKILAVRDKWLTVFHAEDPRIDCRRRRLAG